MRIRMLVALVLATVVVGPASAQDTDNDRGGVRTETMSRIAGGSSYDLIFNVVGLLGLLGLIGIQGEHSDDSYHPAPIE
ncbi:MAG: WGxxGxxG family protein [Sphingomicrobium sp.]